MATEPIPVEELRKNALRLFVQKFEEPATVCACAPGRVNLIGEHVDYNEGFVLPMALPLVTVIAGRANSRRICRLFTQSGSIGAESSSVEFDLDNLKPGEPKWANYVKGSVANFHCDVPGFDAVILSTVPAGAGLSSSAALEVATYTFLEALTGTNANQLVNKALACQKAEHEFAGVPCGPMDQLVSVLGQAGCALLLDCRDLSFRQVQVPDMDDLVFLVTDSNSPHRLGSSGYRARRDACHEAARMLGLRSLREATVDALKGLETLGAPAETVRYSRHVVTEIQRTQEAAKALEDVDLVRFGNLMNQSHQSLRDDYQVSSKELDTLVDTARTVEGVLGARLTGAGFGGCTVTLLKKNSVQELIQRVNQKYEGRAAFYIASPSAGAKTLPVD